MSAPESQDQDCPCNTGAGKATIDVLSGGEVDISACRVWSVQLDVVTAFGVGITLWLNADEAREIAEALTTAADLAEGTGEVAQ